jgi:hypothetical protein
MHDAPTFIHSDRPFLPPDAPVTHCHTLVLHIAAPGGVDGAVNSENDRLILTKSAFLSQKRGAEAPKITPASSAAPG